MSIHQMARANEILEAADARGDKAHEDSIRAAKWAGLLLSMQIPPPNSRALWDIMVEQNCKMLLSLALELETQDFVDHQIKPLFRALDNDLNDAMKRMENGN